ncbi:MAG: hypothetical protein PHC90_08535 [Syntrophorhabdaceae bacterium]|nr:hypothetical protein [Syntrophorhabdaceae bacterium]
MPLAFHSLSHGEVAFGFFNIDTDMMLLDVHFFFADDFSAAVSELASFREDGPATVSLDAYTLDRGRIGNLMGAIHGIEFQGFIGDVYRRFPFPAEEEKFRQQPEGFENHGVIEEIIESYAGKRTISITCDDRRHAVDIGGYLFDKLGFHALVLYVWRGGYPRWRDNLRPACVMEMMNTIEQSRNPLFQGLKRS